MSKVIRDARGMSSEELYIRDKIAQGERMISVGPILQLLEDITTMRREVYIDKALDRTNEMKRHQIDDLDFVINLKRKAAFND